MAMKSEPTVCEHIRTPEAAKLLGISVAGLEKMRRDRRSPPYIRVTTKLILYPIADLRAWLDARTVKPIE